MRGLTDVEARLLERKARGEMLNLPHRLLPVEEEACKRLRTQGRFAAAWETRNANGCIHTHNTITPLGLLALQLYRAGVK